jgi:hypothetical protein
MGACSVARSQIYNVYDVILYKERKLGKKTFKDTVIINICVNDTSIYSAKSNMMEYANMFGLKALVKYRRRLTKNEEKRVLIYNKK